MNEKICITFFLIFLISSIIETTRMPFELTSDDTSELREVREICNETNGCQSSIKPLQIEKVINSSNLESVEEVDDFNKNDTSGEDFSLNGTSTARHGYIAKLSFEVEENVAEKKILRNGIIQKFGLDIYVNNIPDLDPFFFGYDSDPYLVMFTKNPKTRSWQHLDTTDYKSNSNHGHWIYRFNLNQETQEALLIEVWDSDNNADDYLGNYQVDLKSFGNFVHKKPPKRVPTTAINVYYK